jgi:hypothetical protein
MSTGLGSLTTLQKTVGLEDASAELTGNRAATKQLRARKNTAKIRMILFILVPPLYQKCSMHFNNPWNQVYWDSHIPPEELERQKSENPTSNFKPQKE